MELWCLDDKGRDSWDWVGPLRREHASTFQNGVEAIRLLKRRLSRLNYCFNARLNTGVHVHICWTPVGVNTWDDSLRQRHWDSTSNWTESKKMPRYAAKYTPFRTSHFCFTSSFFHFFHLFIFSIFRFLIFSFFLFFIFFFFCYLFSVVPTDAKTGTKKKKRRYVLTVKKLR